MAIPFLQGVQLAQLRRQLQARERGRSLPDPALLSTGCRELDNLLPQRGLRRGTVLEWLSAGPGSGTSALALAAMRSVVATGGVVVVCDREAAFFPTALLAAGIDLRRVIVVRAKSAADHRWAIDQSLRSAAVAFVWARLTQLDDKTARRFQLAAERGGAIGCFIRPLAVRGQPTWAEVQLCVTPLGGQELRAWRVECTRARGPTPTTTIHLGWEETTGTLRALPVPHETRPLPMAPRLARATRA